MLRKVKPLYEGILNYEYKQFEVVKEGLKFARYESGFIDGDGLIRNGKKDRRVWDILPDLCMRKEPDAFDLDNSIAWTPRGGFTQSDFKNMYFFEQGFGLEFSGGSLLEVDYGHVAVEKAFLNVYGNSFSIVLPDKFGPARIYLSWKNFKKTS